MKRWFGILLSICLIWTLTGCSGSETTSTESTELTEGSIYMYYIDPVKYELLSKVYTVDANQTEDEVISDLLSNLFKKNIEGQTNLIPSSMKVVWYYYNTDTHMLQMRVNVANELDDSYVEALSKAAITNTLCQLDYVSNVQFEIYDSSTMMENGNTIETYDEVSFVNAEAEGGYLQKGVITLYFANETGDMLVEYDKSVEITNNVSLEQLVIESLITGPLRDGYNPTIPVGTTLKKISIKDGVCYVDLSGEFNNTLDSCMDMVTIYSIVNSLCALPTINKVQFLINGEKQAFYRETIPFDGMFEQEMDMVEPEEVELPLKSKDV